MIRHLEAGHVIVQFGVRQDPMRRGCCTGVSLFVITVFVYMYGMYLEDLLRLLEKDTSLSKRRLSRALPGCASIAELFVFTLPLVSDIFLQ